MKLEDILSESIMKELSPEAKDKIISEYIAKNVDITDYKIRNKIDDILVREINKKLETKIPEISEKVMNAYDEAIKDKGLIQTWIYKRHLRRVAETILKHV